MTHFSASDAPSTIPGSDWGAAWAAKRFTRHVPKPHSHEPSQQDESSASFSESRRTEADHVAWQLSTRDDLDEVPGPVQDFLFGPWAEAIAHARLMGMQGVARARRYEAAIADLVWSVKPDALRRPAEALQRVPPLLATLREGLALLESDEASHETFFDELMKLHRPVLRLRRSREKLGRSGPPTGPSKLAAVHEPDAIIEPAPEEIAGRAGFEETEPSLPGTGKGTGTGTGTGSNALFRKGDKVQMQVDGRTLLAAVTWVSTEGTFYMFAAEGGKQFSMTRRICQRLLLEGTLRRLA